MLTKVYSIYDQQGETYGNLFLAQNVNLAKRTVVDAARDSLLGMHPQDFELWEVAEFDTVTGVLDPTNKRIERVRDILNAYRDSAETNINSMKEMLEE